MSGPDITMHAGLPPSVHLAFGDDVAILRLRRPEKRNAIDEIMAAGLATAITMVASSDSKALVLLADGPAFCAGGDLVTLKAAVSGDIGTPRAILDYLRSALLGIEELPIPLVCGAQGAVAGAGISLALSADLLIATPDTRFDWAFLALGASPDTGAAWRLAQSIGYRKAVSFALMDQPMFAAEAVNIGLVSHIVESDLERSVLQIARRLALQSREAVCQTKRLLREARCRSLADQLDDEQATFLTLIQSPAFAEGAAHFLAKRGHGT